MRRTIALLGLLALGACSTSYPMPYSAPSGIAANQPPGPVAQAVQVQVTRRAGSDSERWIGTIRGGMGNPLKHVEADRPVKDVVRDAVDAALAARGWLARRDPRIEILVTVRQFDANRAMRQEATAEIEMRLRERSSGRMLWQETERVYNLTGSLIAFDVGIFASPDDLHALMLRTMNEAIDRLLDRPDFGAALMQAART